MYVQARTVIIMVMYKYFKNMEILFKKNTQVLRS